LTQTGKNIERDGNMKTKNKIWILLGTSASGKTTIGVNLGLPELRSTTTRKKRQNEIGNEYFFTSKLKFKIQSFFGLFAEYALYSENHYGLKKSEIRKKLKKSDVYFIADSNGVDQMKKTYPNNVKVVYIDVDKDVVKDRMSKRGDSEAEIEKRINYSITKNEFDNAKIADYVIDNNGDIKEAIEEVLQITRPTIHIDVDGVMTKSKERVCGMYNFEHNANVDWRKNRKWDFSDILDINSKEELTNIFENDYFYNMDYMKLMEEASEFIENIKKLNVNLQFVTVGTKKNLVNKEKMLNELFPDMKVVSIEMDDSYVGKNSIDFKHNDIIIDDHMANLDNGISDTILFEPNGVMDWNLGWNGNVCTNLYDVYLYIKSKVQGG